MDNDWDNRIHTDESGNEWLTDGKGELLRDERGKPIPPQQSKVVSKEGEFTLYDGSRGHCELCGSLSCRGSCFK